MNAEDIAEIARLKYRVGVLEERADGAPTPTVKLKVAVRDTIAVLQKWVRDKGTCLNEDNPDYCEVCSTLPMLEAAYTEYLVVSALNEGVAETNAAFEKFIDGLPAGERERARFLFDRPVVVGGSDNLDNLDKVCEELGAEKVIIVRSPKIRLGGLAYLTGWPGTWDLPAHVLKQRTLWGKNKKDAREFTRAEATEIVQWLHWLYGRAPGSFSVQEPHAEETKAKIEMYAKVFGHEGEEDAKVLHHPGEEEQDRKARYGEKLVCVTHREQSGQLAYLMHLPPPGEEASVINLSWTMLPGNAAKIPAYRAVPLVEALHNVYGRAPGTFKAANLPVQPPAKPVDEENHVTGYKKWSKPAVMVIAAESGPLAPVVAEADKIATDLKPTTFTLDGKPRQVENFLVPGYKLRELLPQDKQSYALFVEKPEGPDEKIDDDNVVDVRGLRIYSVPPANFGGVPFEFLVIINGRTVRATFRELPPLLSYEQIVQLAYPNFSVEYSGDPCLRMHTITYRHIAKSPTVRDMLGSVVPGRSVEITPGMIIDAVVTSGA